MAGPYRKPPRQVLRNPASGVARRAVPCRAVPGVFTPPFRHALCCGKLTSSAHYRGGSSQELIDPDALLLRAPMGSRPRSAHLCTKHVLGTGAEWRFEAALPAVDNVCLSSKFPVLLFEQGRNGLSSEGVAAAAGRPTMRARATLGYLLTAAGLGHMCLGALLFFNASMMQTVRLRFVSC